uniref:Uncharacterized protein n=1 Tax=Micrurus lemniscatus lemniscatus TaxID=129467 RepID=A0A2D4HBI7_MICLE
MQYFGKQYGSLLFRGDLNSDTPQPCYSEVCYGFKSHTALSWMPIKEFSNPSFCPKWLLQNKAQKTVRKAIKGGKKEKKNPINMYVILTTYLIEPTLESRGYEAYLISFSNTKECL